ncbi:MAG: STT3 domain-containing protein [Candidatus Anstonellales archaeon]
MKIEKSKLFNWAIISFLLLIIIYLSIYVRLSTLDAQTILDYDPWWYYRHALEIMNNNFVPLKWDYQTYYPPGRLYEVQLGFEYTMILFYKIAQFIFGKISFMFIAKISPLIMVALGAIPAFLLGRILSNNWGGLATALFALLTPTFIGVSMAGYCDNDPVVVFYTFLCILSVFLALKKKSIPFYIFAIISNLLFVFNWGGGWFVLIILTTSIFSLFFFRIFEEIVHQRKIVIEIGEPIREIKELIIPYLIILIPTNIISFFLGLGNIFSALLIMLGFMDPSRGLLVNISVAELQRIKILSYSGFLEILGRIGYAPLLISLLIIPFIILKLYKKNRLDFFEFFLILWYFATFYMISSGIRFSLSFSVAAAATAGYVTGNLVKYLKRDFIGATIFGTITILSLIFISNAIQVGNASRGMEISENWINALDWLVKNANKNSLVVTWWDPGHIITGYSYDKGNPLKVHADGAHCGPELCIPYNHNIRIRDMGRIFSTSSEEEAVSILKKYKELSFEDCEKVKKTFGDNVPKNACDPVNNMYVIASSDLIGKYYWLSFFGSYDVKKKSGEGRNFIQLGLTNYNQQKGILEYGNGIISIVQKDNKLVPILNIPTQGIRNAVIKDMIYFYQGQQINQRIENATLNGLLFVDPSYRLVIFMDENIEKSIFTNMFFFNGNGLKEFNITKLEQFELKYSNPEVKIFEIKF